MGRNDNPQTPRPSGDPRFRVVSPIGDADLDTQCAFALGWHAGDGGAIGGIRGYQWGAYWYNRDGQQMAPRVTDLFAGLVAWSPSTDPIAALILENEIERRGLQGAYVAFLRLLVTPIGDYRSDNESAIQWALLRAAPERRARAFLMAVQEAPHAHG